MLKHSRLPTGYKEVAWIESTGTQYIDTGVKGNQDTKIVFDFQLTDLAQPKRFYGYRGGSGSSNNSYIAYEDKWFFMYGNNFFVSSVYTDLLRHVIILDKNKAYYDNILVQTFASATFTTTENLVFMSAYYNGNYNNGTYCKTYSCQVYDNGVLIRNFIPAIQLSNNEVGLYDLVTKQFFTNQGTGSFISGPDVVYTDPYDVLPTGYQRLEYIESTGTQYIDTGLQTNYNYRLSVRFMYPNTGSGTAVILGARIRLSASPWSKNGTSIFVNSTDGIRFDFGDSTANSFVEQTPGLLNVTIDKTGGYVNGIKEIDFSGATFIDDTPSGNMLLCAINDTGTNPGIRSFFSGKLYGCQIWNLSELIRDFIPCYRTSDNEAGLYDTVTNTFFTNQGTGSFIMGPEVKPISIYHGRDIVKRVCKGRSIVFNALPNEYQEVEYIKSTGTQYIDTGFVPVQNIKIELDYKSTKQVGEAFQCIFGAQKSVLEGRCYMLAGSNGNLQINYPRNSSTYAQPNEDGTVSYESTGVGHYVFPNSRIKWTYNDANKTISNGVLTWVCSAFTEPFVSPSCNLYLLTRNTAGTADANFATGYLYGFKIWAGENLVRNFIPCYRKSDNEAGLYDIVNGVFYTNAGTGAFTKGPLVYLPNEYQAVEYIESTGTQYIDTGCQVTAGQTLVQDAVIQFTSLNESSTSGFLNGGNSGMYWGIYANRFVNTNTSGLSPYIQQNIQKHHFISTIDTTRASNTLKIDDSTYTSTRNNPYADSSIYICTYIIPPKDLAKEKIYSYKIFVDNILVRDFIPCYRKSDSEIGLFDMVKGVFYTNSGTGTFIKGQNV